MIDLIISLEEVHSRANSPAALGDETCEHAFSVLTFNKGLAECEEVLGHESMAAALIDWVLHPMGEHTELSSIPSDVDRVVTASWDITSSAELSETAPDNFATQRRRTSLLKALYG